MSFNRQKLDGHPGPFNIARKVVNTSADYVMQPEDDNVIVNAAGHTVHLPLGGGGLVALEHSIYAQGVSTTVDGNGSLINGAASISLSANEASQITWDPSSQSWVAGFMSGSPAGGGSGLFNTALVNGQNNNVNTNGFSVVRSGGNTAAAQISGWHAPSLPGPGQTSRFVYVNSTNFPITIQNENAGSIPTQRIQTLRGVDLVLPQAGSSAAFIYDSTVSRWVAEHIGTDTYAQEVVNVKDFGAVGDGVTDDTAALLAALAAAQAAGSSLRFPCQTFAVSATLFSNPSGPGPAIHIYGENAGGSAGTVLKWIGPSSPAAVAITGATNASPVVLTVADTASFAVGDIVNVLNVAGTTSANGRRMISAITPGAPGTVTLHGIAGNGAYAGGGTIQKLQCVLRLQNATGASVEYLNIIGSPNALTGAAIAMAIMPDTTLVGGATDNMLVHKCTLQSAGAGSVNLLMGDGSAADVSQVRCTECQFFGAYDPVSDGATCELNVSINGPSGNTKDFALDNCLFAFYLQAGVYVSCNGDVKLDHPIFGTTANPVNAIQGGRVADVWVQSCQELQVLGAESEGSCRTLYCDGVGNNQLAATVKGYVWEGNTQDFHTLAPGALQDVTLYWGAQLSLEGYSAINTRTGTSQATCRFGGAVSSFFAKNCFFGNSPVMPLFDLAGNSYFSDTVRLAQAPIEFSSCVGTPAGVLGTPIIFPTFQNQNLNVGAQSFLQNSQNPSVLVCDTPGILCGAVAKYEIDFSTMSAAGNPAVFELGLLPQNAVVQAVVCNTTQAWSLIAGDPTTLAIGDDTGAHNQYIQANSISVTGLLGDSVNASILGTYLMPPTVGADLIVGGGTVGYMPGFIGNSRHVQGSLANAGGALSGLAAGHTNIYVFFKVLP